MKKLSILIILLASVLTVNAQVQTIFSQEKTILETVKVIKENKKAKLVKKFAPFDVQKRLDEDAANEGFDVPFRFGEGFDTDITLSEENWTKVENGRLWAMEFESTGAYSINFVFNNFYLPEGAELYIANCEETMLYGPVTSKQNTKNGFFLTDLVQGDNVTLYLFEPADKQGQAKLTVKRVVHAYKNLLSNLFYGNYGSSGSCNNNIDNFPAWDLESDAVALVLLSSGFELCSGSLLMTADQSFRPFFLTAFHCIDVNENSSLSAAEIADAENWMFKFQYKQSTYTGNSSTSGITYNGAAFRAAWNNTDFALMEMDNSPAGDTRFSWLGWDRSGNRPTSGTGIHHPSGDVMKISFDNDAITETANGMTSGTSHWYVDIDNGTLEHGSSGSSLFNQNERVIGQLHGGYPGCNSSKKFWYGCFHRSWTGGGTNATRLSNWLDPTGSGAMTTNTLRSPTLSGHATACPGSAVTFTISNLPAGATVSWSAPNSFSVESSSNTSVTYNISSSLPFLVYTVTANISTGGNHVTTLTHNVHVHTGKVSISGAGYVGYLKTETYTAKLINPCNQPVSIEWRLNGNLIGTGGTIVIKSVAQPVTSFKNTDGIAPNTGEHQISRQPEGVYYAGYMLTVTAKNSSGTQLCSASKDIAVYGYPSITDFPLILEECVSPEEGLKKVENSSGKVINIYPNPVSDILNIDIAGGAASDIRLYDSYGVLLRQQKTGGGTVQLNVSNLPNGLYYLHIYDGINKMPEVRQIMVKH
ncbi:MAG: T9SS type A sorting domain-containing protein [Cytophagaceae bacterium]|jgi:hypothetical protein|nr:T9SS type A sorting domain-containing protein [Cytophagaceae bacterium]